MARKRCQSLAFPTRRLLSQRILSESGHQGPAKAIAVSAKTLELDPVSAARFLMPAGEGGPLHILHQYAKVLKTDYDGELVTVDAEVPESIRRLNEYKID